MEINLNSGNFDSEVINSDIPVLVDFWAPWCNPCKMIAPHIEEIANEYDNKIKVCKLNIDEAADIATKFTVMSIPTLMLFKNREIMEKRVGAISKNEIKALIQPYLE